MWRKQKLRENIKSRVEITANNANRRVVEEEIELQRLEFTGKLEQGKYDRFLIFRCSLIWSH